MNIVAIITKSFRINFIKYTSHNSINPYINPFGLHLSPEILLNFLSASYPNVTGANFQIYGVEIIGKCICESKKLKVGIFTHAPPREKLSQAFYNNTPQAEENYPSPLGSIFRKSILPPISRRRKRGAGKTVEQYLDTFRSVSEKIKHQLKRINTNLNRLLPHTVPLS